MNRNQRLALLGVAAVIVVVAIVVLPSLGSDDNDGGQTQQQAARTTPPADTSASEPGDDGASTQRATTQAQAQPQAPLLRAGKETEIEVTKGDTVRFRVRNPTAEEVHVHGYDIKRDLEPNKTETVSFKADIEGIFEIELEQSGQPLAKLTVEPD